MSNLQKSGHSKFPCPLCRRELEIRMSKKDKPYCVCQDCGIQMFVRHERGINRLEKVTDSRRTDWSEGSKTHGDLKERVSQLKKELQRVNREIEEDFWEERPELRAKRDEILWEIRMYGG